MNEDNKFIYDSGDKRFKHKWKNNFADLTYKNGRIVGMCPKTLTQEVAEKLLNNGTHYSPEGWTEDHPKEIYKIYDGALYRAVITIPGKSYHGFPSNSLPPKISDEVIRVAKADGELKGYDKWIKSQTGKRV